MKPNLTPEEERIIKWVGKAIRHIGPFGPLLLALRASNRAKGLPKNTPIQQVTHPAGKP